MVPIVVGNQGPNVSVVMAVFNGERYLVEAVESILNQTYRDFEFIIIDDGSTDSSLEILKRYEKQDQRIQLVVNGENIGPPLSLNKGIALSKGKYIARMDQDDVSLPDRFKIQIVYLDEHPDIWVLGTNVKRIDEKGKYLNEWKLPVAPTLIKWNSIFRNSGVVCHPTVMMRRNLFDFISGYDESEPFCDDLELWTRLFWLDDIWIGNIVEILLFYRVHEKSISIKRSSEQHENSNKIRASLLSKYLNKTVDPITIAAYESTQELSKEDAEEIIPVWFETYQKFSTENNLNKEEQSLIFKEILVRTPHYVSLLPRANKKWVVGFLPSLHLNYVLGMTFVKAYNLLSGIKIYFRKSAKR